MGSEENTLYYMRIAELVIVGISMVLSGLGFIGSYMAYWILKSLIYYGVEINEVHVAKARALWVFFMPWVVISVILSEGIQRKPLQIKCCSANRMVVATLYIILVIVLDFAISVCLNRDIAETLRFCVFGAILYLQHLTFKEREKASDKKVDDKEVVGAPEQV